MADQKLLTTDLPESDVLSDSQRLFKDEYLKCWNATEAARRARYKQPSLAGYRLIRNDKIRAAINDELDAHAVGAKHVLAVLSEQARLNLGDFLDEGAKIDPAKVKKRGDLVKKYKYKLLKTVKNGDQIFDVELELIDSQAALFFLGKHNNLIGSDASNLIEGLCDVLARVLEAELPRELAGRVLRRVSNDLRTLRN